MTWKLYAVVSAGAFVATYLVSSPAKDVARASSPPRSAAQKPAPESDIEQLAERLHVRLRTEENYRTPGRDLFRFQSRPVTQPVVRPTPPAFVPAPVAAPAPVLPTLSLSGVATDTVDGSPRRSAILSAPAGVLIVREGESVGGLYKVLSIGEESVELEAVADGSHRTLRLSGR